MVWCGVIYSLNKDVPYILHGLFIEVSNVVEHQSLNLK